MSVKPTLDGEIISLQLVSAFTLIGEPAAQVVPVQNKSNVGKDILERMDTLSKKAWSEINELKGLAQPKKVRSVSFPEVILENSEISFNGEKLNFGKSFHLWKKVIPGTPRCLGEAMTLCIWDELGIEVGTDVDKPQNVSFFNIYFNLEDDYEAFIKQVYPNGRPGEPLLDLKLHHAFPGYLELNGYGVNAELKFWEIRKGSSANSKIHCGLLDCSNPRGPFGKNGHISFSLNGRSENSTVQRIGVDGTE